VIRRLPNRTVIKAAPTAAISSVTANGAEPSIHRKETRTLAVFCSNKMITATNTSAVTDKATHMVPNFVAGTVGSAEPDLSAATTGVVSSTGRVPASVRSGVSAAAGGVGSPG
jgi:hypothetical protein